MTLDQLISQLTDLRQVLSGKCEVEIQTYTSSVQEIESVTLSGGSLKIRGKTKTRRRRG